MSFQRISSLLLLFAATALAAPAQVQDASAAAPTVVLDSATVTGKVNGTVIGYYGLPYAQPPVGNLRLNLPQEVEPYTGSIDATSLGNQCIQQTSPITPIPDDVPDAVDQYLAAFLAIADVPQSEDCLNLNVIVPANVTADSKLAVAVWMYGGGFQLGSNALLPGENVVARSIEIGHPIIYIALNYRLSAYGFLGGKEVKAAGVGNLGLQDQRQAFRWIQKYISAFGGDPTKVMIWGESAGAMSVAFHMMTNNGDPEGLFRAGFMESGNAVPSGVIDSDYMQQNYDSIVEAAGCASESDTLQCLRTVEAEVLTAAMDKSPSITGFNQIQTPWFPRADGVFLTEPPEQQLVSGAPVAPIPFVTGNDEDEGTIFSFATINITTDAEFLDYLGSNYYTNTSQAALEQVLTLYPSDPADGAPFNTGDANAWSPQYKRMSAFQTDFIEQAPRRLFVQQLSGSQPVYAYLSLLNQVDGIGATHASEIPNIYNGGDLGDYLIRFADTLSPNGDGAVNWPQYTNDSPQLLTFSDTAPLNITLDTYRADGMALLTNLSLADPL